MSIIKQIAGLTSESQTHKLGETAYVFDYNNDGYFVCDVKNPKHAKQFLSHEDDFVLVSGVVDEIKPKTADSFKGKSKSQLAEYALDKFNVELDVTKTVKELVAEILVEEDK